MDSLCHLICTNNFKSSIISIPSPFRQNQIIDLFIEPSENTKIAVSIINGTPYIEVNAKLKATVASSSDNLNLTEKENIELIEQYASSYMQNKLLEYLYTTSKNFHSDIACFGKYIASYFLTIEDFENLNWPHLYSDSFFNANVKINVVNGALLVQN